MRRQALELTEEERVALEALVARRRAPAGHVRRARVVLLSADGVRGREIARRLGISEESVSIIRSRFLRGRVAGLADQPKAGRKDHAVSKATEKRIVDLALSPPPEGRSRWTARLLAAEVDLSHVTVAKVLGANDIKPHRKRTFKISKDPQFAAKVEDVVGLYLNPPENAVVLSVDEKTQIQALERTQRPLPLRRGRAVRHTHDYKRNGVVDLYAAFNVGTGEVAHRCTDTHTSADFLAFMRAVAKQHPRVELHVILDNSSTHRTPAVQAWLAANPRVTFHYTPTSASWLNEVEAWFSILGKQALWISDFPSKKALRERIEAFVAHWNARPTPFIWTKPADALIRKHRELCERNSLTVH